MSIGSFIQGAKTNIGKDAKGIETGFIKILPYAIIGLIVIAVAKK